MIKNNYVYDYPEPLIQDYEVEDGATAVGNIFKSGDDSVYTTDTDELTADEKRKVLNSIEMIHQGKIASDEEIQKLLE